MGMTYAQVLPTEQYGPQLTSDQLAIAAGWLNGWLSYALVADNAVRSSLHRRCPSALSVRMLQTSQAFNASLDLFVWPSTLYSPGELAIVVTSSSYDAVIAALQVEGNLICTLLIPSNRSRLSCRILSTFTTTITFTYQLMS
jgi:hypothetical protein